jgi:hypothetical protein
MDDQKGAMDKAERLFLIKNGAGCYLTCNGWWASNPADASCLNEQAAGNIIRGFKLVGRDVFMVQRP